MATLNEVMKDTADAIREKTGKSELIKPVDFASEIKGITAGGGESGDSSWRYFNRTQKEPANEVSMQLAVFTLLKQTEGGQSSIMPVSYAVSVFGNEFYKQAACLAIDLNMPFLISGAPLSTVGEFLAMSGMDLDTIVASFNYTEITEEEFYDLNA
jgi:hypothetical protein